MEEEKNIDKTEENSVEEKIIEESQPEEKQENESPAKEKRTLKSVLTNNKKPVLIGMLVVIILVALFSFLKRDTDDFSIVSIEKESSTKYVANNEVFTVKTKGGSLEEVQKHIYIEPAVSYRVDKKSKNEYKVVTKDIPSNQIVNLEYIDNKVVEDAWAFQSTKDLTVTSVYPANGTSSISEKTAIEISFSYPDVEDINKSVVIEPKVEGKFEQNGRIWTLKPTKPLKKDQTYTITIKEDIKAGNHKLKEGMKTTFSTHVANKTINYESITLDNIETFKTTENPMFITTSKIAKVEMLQFNSNEDFRKYISNETNYKIKSLGNPTLKKLNHDLYMVNKKYDKGYYLLKAFTAKNQLCFSIPIQVNNLQAYLMTTENDLLVWTSSNNNVQKNVDISYEKSNVKTDNDGLAIIKKYNDKQNKIKYVKVGKDNPLYIGVSNNDFEEYPSSYIYTDRPLYKNTDDVRIFGYIPLKYFENGANKNDFVLSCEDVNIPIKINDDGTFTTKYHLDNMKSDYMSLSLKYKDNYLAYRGFEVKEYEKEMYDFKIEMDKNYVYAGQSINFKVKVTHISGVYVPNKTIKMEYDDSGRVVYAKTNSKGEAHFSIKTSRDSDPSSIYHTEDVTLKSTLTESSQEGYSFTCFIIDRLVDISHDDFDVKDKRFTAKANNLTTNKNIKTIDWGVDELLDKPYNGNAKIQIEETKYVEYITGYEYDEITKENIPEYDYDSDTKVVKEDNYTIKDGKIDYKVDYDFKKDTDDTSYSYSMVITLKDSKNLITKYDFYLFDNDSDDYKSNLGGYYRYENAPLYNEYYNLYNYYMPETESVYSVNSKIIRNLFSYNGQKEVTNNKVLLIKYKNNIIDKKIVNSTSELSTTFNDDDRPGVKITGAYLKNGRVYRLPSEYLDYNEEDSKLNVDIKPNKTKYKPQEEVTVDLKVTKKNVGTKSTVNVSVVDEGVFKTEEDYTNILENLYYDMYYNQYTYSTYRDYNLFIEGGGKGSTSGPGSRKDFGDTIFFETVETDDSGAATVKFKMNDSITSFRITAHATTKDVDAGVSHTNIESTIPLAISFKKPLGVKETDDVVLNALGIGTVNSLIKYEFSIKGKDKKITKSAHMSDTVYANFGKLLAGTYTAIISAKSGDKTDKVEFEFNVVKTQTEISVKTTKSIKDAKSIKPTKNPIKLEIFRNSFKTYEKYLDTLKETNKNRLDTKFTYNKALEFENKYDDKEYILDLGDIQKYTKSNGYKYLPGDQDVSYELTAILTHYDKELAIKKSVFYKLVKSKDISKKLDGYMNLAAQKEPILDDLNSIKDQVSDANIDKLALSYILLGDYKSAKEYYDKITNEGIKAYVSTFIDKKNASKLIDELHNKDIANRYVYLAMVSFFENNNAGLSTKEKVTISYGKKKQEVNVPSLGKKYLTISQKDLEELKFKSRFNDINITYYYDGLLEDIDDSKKVKNITCKLLTKKVTLGKNVTLQVNISKVHNYSNFDLYLPNGLTMGDTFKSRFVSVVSSTKEHVTFFIDKKESNTINIPLYASSPGNYTIEPIVIKNDDNYQISNPVSLTIKEK